MGQEAAWIAVGALMKSLRRTSGMSLREAARQASRSPGQVSSAEKGRDRPGVELITFYEETFGADGVLWSAYTAARVSRPDPPVTKNPARYPIDGDASEFIADISIPDGTLVRPGEKFIKTWRIKNSGTVPWDSRFLSRIGPPVAHGLPRSAGRVSIDYTPPGEFVDISVPMRAHYLAGSSQVLWKMTDEEGYEFFPDRYFQGLVMHIIVRGDPVDDAYVPPA